MDDALRKIREAFGDDALIVGTRTFRRGGLLGVGGQDMVEVYVADTRSRVENLRREGMHRGLAEPASLDGERNGLRAGGPDRGEGYEQMSATLGQLREDIQQLLARAPEHGGFTHPFLRQCYEFLIERDIAPKVADGVVREVANLRLPPGFPDPNRVSTVLRAQLARLFIPNPVTEGGGRPRVLMFIGPTGVGKTTTIAKLAARAKINEQRKVGLITLDTFRIAAVDQLQKYAEIIGVPLRVVTDPAELQAAVAACREEDLDVVFVDTAGRSHRDELKMAELKEFVTAVPEAELHLVLSSTTHHKTTRSIVERFQPLGFHRVALTKLDESVSRGTLISSLLELGKPVSYITDGQNVPDDIMPADPERLADLLLKTPSL
jgi:flagellar biosynthesis protein FlhF